MHEDLILHTPCSISGKPRTLAVIERLHSLHEPERPDRDEFIQLLVRRAVFAGDVCDQTQIVGGELVPGGLVALFHALEALTLLRGGQRFWEQMRRVRVENAQDQPVQKFQQHKNAPFQDSL